MRRLQPFGPSWPEILSHSLMAGAAGFDLAITSSSDDARGHSGPTPFPTPYSLLLFPCLGPYSVGSRTGKRERRVGNRRPPVAGDVERLSSDSDELAHGHGRVRRPRLSVDQAVKDISATWKARRLSEIGNLRKVAEGFSIVGGCQKAERL